MPLGADVESFLYYLSKLYKNFIVYYKEADGKQIERLAKNVEVHKYTKPIKCDRFFCSYGYDIEVEAKEYYHIIHYDALNVGFTPMTNDDFKYIGVSKVACENFEKKTGNKCELIYNPVPLKPLKVKKKTDKLHLISATRLTSEKGGERINKLAKILDESNIDYDWKIYTNKINYRFTSKNIETIKQKLDLTKEIAQSTYLVQLSSCESFGLSVCESLILGTPVIVTDLEAFKEIGCKHGENAIICDLNMKNVDIKLIKKGIPKFKYTPPEETWGKYLNNDTTYDPNELIKVRTKKRIWDLETDLHYRAMQQIELKRYRAGYFEALDYIEIIDKRGCKCG